mgnify:CR=1 FL=1
MSSITYAYVCERCGCAVPHGESHSCSGGFNLYPGSRMAAEIERLRAENERLRACLGGNLKAMNYWASQEDGIPDFAAQVFSEGWSMLGWEFSGGEESKAMQFYADLNGEKVELIRKLAEAQADADILAVALVKLRRMLGISSHLADRDCLDVVEAALASRSGPPPLLGIMDAADGLKKAVEVYFTPLEGDETEKDVQLLRVVAAIADWDAAKDGK